MKDKFAKIAYETFFNSVMITNGHTGEDAPVIPEFCMLQDDLKKAWIDAAEAVIESMNIEELSDEEYKEICERNGFPPTIGSVAIDKAFVKALEQLGAPL